jgi:DNA-directed RNA polymerase subunit L
MDPHMTQRFEVANYLVMIEGEAHSLALLVGMLYADPNIPRDGWSVSHALKSRKELIAHLQTQGETRMRVGISAESDKVVEQMRRRADALQVQFNVLRTKSHA